jgi:hypothetical protein
MSNWVTPRIAPRIIVEGMDGSGKSTLAQQLAEEFRGEVVKNEKGPRDDLGSWWEDCLKAAPTKAEIFVHDRFFYPEFVYGPILRGTVSVFPTNIEVVSKWIRSFAFLVYCRPDVEVIRAGAAGREQWPGVMPNFLPLLQAYDTIMTGEIQWYGNRFFRYDWQNDQSYNNLRVAIANWMMRYYG